MKIILSTLLLVISFSSFSVEREVIDRNDRDKLVIKKVKLKELISDKYYDGKFFKIVYKTTDEMVKIDDSEVSKKAANVYYHLTRAKDFFTRIGHPQKEKIIIRMEIENAYHKLYHYQNAKLNPVYNNAATIAAGTAVEDFGIAAWGNEIWFRPSKKIPLTKEERKLFKKLSRQSIPKGTQIDADVAFYTAINAAISQDAIESAKQSTKTLLENFLISSTLRIAVPELVMLFMKKDVFFEASFIPEVIYHEYTHFAMADFIKPIINTTVLEGFADFYAVQISGRTKLAHKLGDYGALVASRSALTKTFYSLDIDTQAGLGTDFVLSLLYEIKEVLTKRVNEDYALKVLFDLRKQMTLDTKIGQDLPDILWNALPQEHRLEIMILLNNRGI